MPSQEVEHLEKQQGGDLVEKEQEFQITVSWYQKLSLKTGLSDLC